MEVITDLEQFAVDMVSFQEEVLKLKHDCRPGKVFETVELGIETADEDNIVEASCIKDIPGISLFTMGPVYVSAQVPYSFLDQYTAEVDRVQFLTFDTGIPVADGLDIVQEGVTLGTWDDKLQAVGSDYLESLTDFMTVQVLKRGDKLFGITFQDAMIQDPIRKARIGVAEDNLVRVRIFTPYTYRGMVVPAINMRTGVIHFTTEPVSAELRAFVATAAKAQLEE